MTALSQAGGPDIYPHAGWSEDEEGRLIPPGWVRVAPQPAEGSADEGDDAEPERERGPGSGPG